MTLQQAKDEIGRKHGYKDWMDFYIHVSNKMGDEGLEEACELYADAKLKTPSSNNGGVDLPSDEEMLQHFNKIVMKSIDDVDRKHRLMWFKYGVEYENRRLTHSSLPVSSEGINFVTKNKVE